MMNIIMASLGAFEIAGGIVVLLAAVVLIAIIVMQNSSNSGLGTIDGGNDSFIAKGKSRNVDAKLRRITMWVAIVFVVIIIALNIVTKFFAS